MKKNLLLLLCLMGAFFSKAQNVGIGTTTPQVTLDVKGNIRTGGINNFILYDSLAGRITWTNSNLWVTNPQYLMKHSPSAEGLYSNGSQLEYRNSTGSPIFFTNWSNGNGYFSGKLGINTINPSARLHIYNGASGITPFFNSGMVVESSNHTYINLLSPDPFETGILFGSGSNAANGVISYNTSATPKGFTFSDNGNLTRMVINSAGNVGIGTTNPQKNLSVQDGMNIDQADGNTGSTVNAITFGNSSGEGIGSKRNPGGNQWGLDFYTNSINRMSITNGGNVGIGTTSPAAKLQVSAGDASLALFGPNLSGGSLYVGAAPVQIVQGHVSTAQVLVGADLNLFIDPGVGKNLYLGYFQATDIYINANGGKVGIGTTIPTATLDVNGYTKLGASAPAIKTKKLTGTTSAMEGGYVLIPHGLTASKILSVSIMISNATDHWIGQNYGYPGYNFAWEISDSNIFVDNVSGDSANILSKPIKILIIYEE